MNHFDRLLLRFREIASKLYSRIFQWSSCLIPDAASHLCLRADFQVGLNLLNSLAIGGTRAQGYNLKAPEKIRQECNRTHIEAAIVSLCPKFWSAVPPICQRKVELLVLCEVERSGLERVQDRGDTGQGPGSRIVLTEAKKQRILQAAGLRSGVIEPCRAQAWGKEDI